MLSRIALLFAMVAVLSSFSAGFACHSNCECKWKQGKRWASCPGMNLITVPSGLPSEIQVINLESNNFQTLPSRIFQERGLTNLQRIYLQHCRLGSVAVDSLHQLTNLVELDLSDNLLTEVPTNALAAASHLRRLHLTNNPISVLRNHSFRGLGHLQHLSLSGCQLHQIELAAFDSLEALRSLYLDNNRLTVLRAETVSMLPRLSELILTGNPWHCDCQLAPLRKWMILRNIGNLYAPYCSTPERIHQVPWSELDVEDFACAPEIALQLNMLYVHVEEGANVTLVCGVRSQPMSLIRWEPAEVGNETYMDPERFHTREERKGHQDVQISSLHIDRTEIDDSGVYVCVSENKAGVTAANFTLHVSRRLLNPVHLGKTGTIGVIAFFVLLAILIALGLCLFVMRQRHCSSADTKVPPNQGFLKQLAVVKTVKGQPEVVPVVSRSPKPEYGVTDRRTENGSSGYCSEQTPDLVNKIDGFEKDIHSYSGPVGNGYANPADPAYRHSPMMGTLNTTYQQDDYALGPIPGEAALSRTYSPEPLPPVHSGQSVPTPPAPHWNVSVAGHASQLQHADGAATYYALPGSGWAQGPPGHVDPSAQIVGLPPAPFAPPPPSMAAHVQQHGHGAGASSSSSSSWGPAPAVPPRAPVGGVAESPPPAPHGDNRYSPDEGYAEETICYEGTEV